MPRAWPTRWQRWRPGSPLGAAQTTTVHEVGRRARCRGSTSTTGERSCWWARCRGARSSFLTSSGTRVGGIAAWQFVSLKIRVRSSRLPRFRYFVAVFTNLGPHAETRARLKEFLTDVLRPTQIGLENASSVVLSMCPTCAPAAPPNAGTARDHVEREGTGSANGLVTMKDNGTSRLEVLTHRQDRSNPFSRSICSKSPRFSEGFSFFEGEGANPFPEWS